MACSGAVYTPLRLGNSPRSICSSTQNRIKTELKAAKGFESAEEEDESKSKSKRPNTYGAEIKRLVKKGDKSGVYDSEDDDEDNPYAVS